MPSRSPSVKKKTSNPKPRPPAAKPPGTIWEAHNFDMSEVGYLVTEKDNLDRPVALVDCSHANSDDGKKVASAISQWFMREPWRAANRECDISVIDLTPFGRPDSTAPMPMVVYSLQCEKMPRKDKDTIATREPRPWCRFLAAELEKRKPSPATAAESKLAPGDDDFPSDLLNQVSDIAQRTTKYLGTSSPLAQKFSAACKLNEYGWEGTREQLEDARKTFAELPSSTREAIYNGWNVCTEPHPREKLVELITGSDTEIVRGIVMRQTQGHSARSDFDHRFICGTHEVELFIREGAGLEDVLLVLRNFERLIRSQWAQLITSGKGGGI